MKKKISMNFFGKSKTEKKREQALIALTVLFAGAFVGSLVVGSLGAPAVNFNSEKQEIAADFKLELAKGGELVVYGGNTWIPVPGNPVETIIVNDPNCKTCDPSQAIATLQQVITPALLKRTVDINSVEGQALVKDYGLKFVPQFILGSGLKTHPAEAGGKLLFTEKYAEVLTEKDGKYLLNAAKVGFKPGQFLEVPQFADMEAEPSQGTGPVQVVEFTDYQCPYCKRFYDQNKALIQKLVAEGIITYTIKDFPLGFHPEAQYAHKAANCVQENSTSENYWTMHDAIFETQKEWSGAGDNARHHMNNLAKNLGVDILACMEDEAGTLEIGKDQAEGVTYGVAGTPAVFVGKQILPGAVGPDVLEAAIRNAQ